MQQPCRLCGEHKKLCLSQIIPKSFTKRIKSGLSQVVELTLSHVATTIKSNFDYKAHLLCEDCEKHLKLCYEDMGTVYLHNKKRASENSDYILIQNFNYKLYYLFIISIIWRAIISKIKIYEPAKEIYTLEPYIRHCIKYKTLYLTPRGPKLDDFIKISIVKIIDSQGRIKQEAIDRLLVSLNFKREKNKKEGLHYYMMLDGFLITTSILPPSSPLLSNWINPGRLLDRKTLKVPKVCFSSIEPLFKIISTIPNTLNLFLRDDNT